MINEKINLLIENSNRLNEIEGFIRGRVYKVSAALSLTLENRLADIEKINLAIEIIKRNTSVISYFRGDNLLITAINIAYEENIEKSFKELLYIYNSLKEFFINSKYLFFASLIIFKTRNKVDVNSVIKKTRICYEYMNRNVILTNKSYIWIATIIATTSQNIKESVRECRECYRTLKTLGFNLSSDVRGVAYTLSLINYETDAKCYKVAKLYNSLDKNGVLVSGRFLPILGMIAFITNNYDNFSKDSAVVCRELRKNKGFSGISLGTRYINAISVALVASEYINLIKPELKDIIFNFNNDMSLEVSLLMQNSLVNLAMASFVVPLLNN
ncbi:MAG: DUF4003 family protein [Clostridium baratii]|uniref:DUF4003 family protein n=1 Tax=Clostridium baratii TaxID=1561 RepID=UPI00242BF4AE|nr:DUF4003 family protein [Clostridium baratii]MBS6042569.1 DUF4003 family protein [Clostridium baratii]